MQNKDQLNNCKATAKPIIRTEYKVKEKSNTMVEENIICGSTTCKARGQRAKWDLELSRYARLEMGVGNGELGGSRDKRGSQTSLNWWPDSQLWWATDVPTEVFSHLSPYQHLYSREAEGEKSVWEGDWVGKEAKECGNLLSFPLPHKPYELMIFYYRPSCIAHGDHQHGEECTLLPRIQC